MEIKTELEYWRELAQKAVMGLENEQYKVLKAFMDDTEADKRATEVARELTDISVDEQEAIRNGDFDGAYETYRERNEPDHIYDVVVSVSYSGTLQVYAKTEEEAREYVNRELCCDEYEPFLADDEQQVDPWEMDGFSHEYNIEEVNDTGEVYEED